MSFGSKTPLQIATKLRIWPLAWCFTFINGHLTWRARLSSLYLSISLSLCECTHQTPFTIFHVEVLWERDLQLTGLAVTVIAKRGLASPHLAETLWSEISFNLAFGNRWCWSVYPAPSSSTMDLSTTKTTTTTLSPGLPGPSKPSRPSLPR